MKNKFFLWFGIASLVLGPAMPSVTIAAPAPTALAPFSRRSSSGNDLVRTYFELLSQTGSPSNRLTITDAEIRAGALHVTPFLDPAFQLQRADGTRFLATNYLPVDVDKFSISEVLTTQPADNVKVTRYAVSTPGAVDPSKGVLLNSGQAPRLTVWRWNEQLNRWLIVSHANFNTPLQAICDQKPVVMTKEPIVATPSDVALGKQLAARWFQLLIAGQASALMHPEIQAQSASGEGYTTINNYHQGSVKSAELSDFEVTRHGDIIVVSLAVKATGTRYGGSTELSERVNPRLLTFLRLKSGEWRLIASATFNPPVRVDASLPCTMR